MDQNLFNTKTNRWWGILPLITLAWNVQYTVYSLHPHYLLFVCYTANLLVGTGIFFNSGLMVGVGFGWSVIGVPLWLYDAVLNCDWAPSCSVFHICGVIIGGLAMKDHRLPNYTWCIAVVVGLFLQLTARMFTDERYNINAAFRVYDGWEEWFPNYPVYFLVMLFWFSGFFILLTWIHNRYFAPERPKNE